MKSPFASLNWGVFQPESNYVLLLREISASGGSDSETSLYGPVTNVYTTFASAFEEVFQRAAAQMDNRVEWFFESEGLQNMTMFVVADQLGLGENDVPSIFDLQGFYNEAPQTAKLEIWANPHSTTAELRALCLPIWNRLSKLENFRNWDDYLAITRRTLTDSEREQLNQAFEMWIESVPSMNIMQVMSFRTEFLDDYYSSETQITLELLPRNMEGRA